MYMKTQKCSPRYVKTQKKQNSTHLVCTIQAWKKKTNKQTTKKRIAASIPELRSDQRPTIYFVWPKGTPL